MAQVQLEAVENKPLFERIGQGTFGNIYSFKKGMCVKIATNNDPQGRLLQKEAENLLLCKENDFFVSIYGAGVNRHGQRYIVLERCQSTLDRYCYENWWVSSDKIPINILDEIVYSILSGISFLHDKGLGHFDLKPSNILVDRGKIRIADLATVHNPNTLEKNGKKIISLCSMHYRAPELMSGNKFGISADMWSLGCIIFSLVTETVLFGGKTLEEVISSMIVGTNDIELFGQLPSGENFNPIDAEGNDRIAVINRAINEVNHILFDRGFWWFRFSNAIRDSVKQSEYGLFGDIVEKCLVGNSSDRLTTREGMEMLDQRRTSPTSVWEDEYIFQMDPF